MSFSVNTRSGLLKSRKQNKATINSLILILSGQKSQSKRFGFITIPTSTPQLYSILEINPMVNLMLTTNVLNVGNFKDLVIRQAFGFVFPSIKVSRWSCFQLPN
jgi:hypothetical protein